MLGGDEQEGGEGGAATTGGLQRCFFLVFCNVELADLLLCYSEEVTNELKYVLQ